jgi:hypothetical protein
LTLVFKGKRMSYANLITLVHPCLLYYLKQLCFNKAILVPGNDEPSPLLIANTKYGRGPEKVV